MSDVNLKRFVNIDIKPHKAPVITTTRDTIVLYTPEGTASTIRTIDSLAMAKAIYSNIVDNEETSDTYKYLEIFFNNGGLKAKVYEGIAYDAITLAMLKALPNELICVGCVVDDEHVEDCYSALKALAIALDNDTTVYGINEKFIIARTCAVTPDTDSVKNFAVKYSSTVGAEMTIAAYVSQVNINTANSVNDYAFTEETLADENIDDTLYGEIQDANMNVDIYLANAVRNCGGNCKDGYDLINSFVKIVLHQTLTAQLVLLLTQKIKSSDGISKIYAVIAQELEKYKTCGYLTTDKVWTDRTLTVTYGDEIFTIIEKGDALLNGYVIKVLPISSLTAEDKATHSTPPIYVIIADQYGIRKITVKGEII